MDLSKLFEILNSIPTFNGKVAYRAFPLGSAPELPFICYLETSSNNAFADNKVYKAIKGIDVEFYSENKDIASETLIEEVFANNMIPWEKDEDYIDSEKCLRVTYSLEV